MRRRLRGHSNLLWWYGGGGDLGRHENITSDCLTTTEECTDTKISEPFKGYPVYGSRVSRACIPPQYFYPVKKRSRRRCVPTACPAPYDGQRNIQAQPQIFLQDCKPSRKTLAVGPRRRVAYTVAKPSPPPPDPVPKSQKMLVYSSTFPAQYEKEQQHANLFWHKVKKYPVKKKLVRWRSQAIDSSTSADVKSVCSNYSRLSVDVTNEMEAMNRDIETILTRYESAFDNTIFNELEERGLGKKRKHKSDVVVKSKSHHLTPEQQNLLDMEKPPLDRLGEIPIEYLKPRPPPSAYAKETTRETSNANGISGSAVWKGMLQDLVNRGVLDKLDDSSLPKLLSALSEVATEPQPRSVVLPPGTVTSKEGNPTAKQEAPSGATCILRPDEITLLSEVDKHIQYVSGATSKVHYAVSVEPKIPNLVERSEDLIPVNRVTDDTNWRKHLIEIQSNCSKPPYEICQTEQLNLFKRGGSGDKLCQDKSVNTDIGENSKEQLDRSRSKNFSSGDQNTTGDHGMSEGAVGLERKSSSTTNTLQDHVKEIESNITVNTMLTDQSMKANSLVSGTTTCHCEELTTNPSSALGMSGVMVEDLEEEEVPLQRTLESTSLGKGSRFSVFSHIRKPIKPISMEPQMDKRHQQGQLATDGARVAKHGAGDSHVMDASCSKDQTSLVQNVSPGINTSNSIDQNLAELLKSISQSTPLNFVDSELCLDIIGKLTELMLSNEPVIDKNKQEPDYTNYLKRTKISHLRHIKQEVDHIKHLEKYSKTRVSCGVKSFQRSLFSCNEFQ